MLPNDIALEPPAAYNHADTRAEIMKPPTYRTKV
jgi:hypothetical protein